MKKHLLLLAILALTVIGVNAQTDAINIKPAGMLIDFNAGTTLDASAIMQINALLDGTPDVPKGFLIPRVTAAEKTAIASPAQGLLIFQTDGTQGFYYYTGTTGTPANTWVLIANTGNIPTSLKWNALTAPDGNLSLAHTNYTTDFSFNTVTTGTAFSLASSGLTSGKLFDLSSSATAFTGTLSSATLSGSNAANTGTVLKATNSGVLNTGTALMVTNAGAATSTSLRVNDDGTDTDASPFLIDAAGNVGIGTTTAATKLIVNSTDAVGMPSGSTAQRPASPASGYTRFNNESLAIEYYDGTQWVSTNMTQVPIGTIAPYGGTTVPAGWLFCDGNVISRTTYATLFAAIGTAYGIGDGSTTFGLPDLRGKAPFGLSGSAPFTPIGTTGGSSAAVTPTISAGSLAVDIAAFALPNHTHSIPAHYHGMGTGATLAIPASTYNTGSEASHTHSIDPASTTTSSNGSHTHWISGGPRDDGNGSGAGSNGQMYGLWADAGTYNAADPNYAYGRNTLANGAHTHTLDIAAFTSAAGSSHLHSIPAMTPTGLIGLVTGGVNGNAAMTSGNPSATNIDPPSTAVTGSGTSSAIDIMNPYLVTQYIIKATNTSSTSIVSVNLPSGSLGQTLYHNGTLWTATNNLWHNNVNVGIGTTVPSALLDVSTLSASDTKSNITNTGTGNVGLELRSAAAAGTQYIDFTNTSTSNTGTGTPDFTNRIISSSTALTMSTSAASNGIVLLNGGNVGMGISPTTKLHINTGTINNTNAATAGILVAGDAAGNPGYMGTRYTLNNSTANYAGFVRGVRTASTTFIGLEIGSETNHGIRFLTNGTADANEKMRLEAAGSLGLGSSSPDGLQVNAAVTETADGTDNVRLGVSGGTPRIIFEDNTFTQWQIDNSAGVLRFYQPGTTYMQISTLGIGIGSGIAATATYGINAPNLKIKTLGIDETSDMRLKKDINPITDALHKVLEMQGVTYNWRKDEFPEKHFEKDLQFGLIAQELEKIIPELVTTDEDGWKAIEYSHLVPVLIEAIKEQQKVIDSEKQNNRDLKATVESLITRMATLENTVEINTNKVEK
jgi:microcystin-dependent protein